MRILLYSLSLLALSCQNTNPFKEIEPTTTDPVIRARELNDSAIDLVTASIRLAEPALAIFDEASALDSTYDKPVLNKLGIYLQLKKMDEAKVCCERLRQMRPYDADLLVCEAMVYRMDGDTANSMAYLSSAQQMYRDRMSNLDSTAPVYHHEANKLALVLWLCGQPAEAEKLVPGMTKEELPGNDLIAAEFWKSMQPEPTQ